MYNIQLPDNNSLNTCSLPNGSNCKIYMRYRYFLKNFTIQLYDENDNAITDECVFAWNDNLFGQYPEITRYYGKFSVLDNNSSNNSSRYKLMWDFE